MNDTMYDYILEQPEALKRVWDFRKEDTVVFTQMLEKNKPDRIFLIGSGTSLNAAKAAAPVMEALLGIEVTPAASSAIPVMYDKKPFLIFISQGGNSTNTVKAIQALSQYPHIALTGAEHCAVNHIAKHITIRCGEEKAGPKTKGYVSTYFLLYCMALEAAKALGIVSEQEYEKRAVENAHVPEQMEKNIQTALSWFEKNVQELKEIEKCVVVGKHIGQAAALEAALKLQETMLIPASGYEYEEFLHGPDMAIDERMAGLYLLPEKSDPDYERFERLVRYHAEQSPYVYTVGGGETFNTRRDLRIGEEDSKALRIFSWCLPSQIMGAKIPPLTGREGKGSEIFKKLDAILNIKAKQEG